MAVGAAVLALPLLIRLSREMWATDEGAYGPLILATAGWLIVRMSPVALRPARGGGRQAALVLLAGALAAYLLACRLDMLGPACVAGYGALIAVYAWHFGWGAVRYAWFPFAYLLLAFPLPETITVPLGQAMKLRLSAAATDLLSSLGLPVANTGVVIYVRQYELLVKTACSGLNSIIGLSAIGTFYAYVVHGGRIPPWFLPMIPAIAIGGNFVRVLVLVVSADLFGSAVVGTSFHDLVALGMYLVSLGLMALADHAFSRRWGRTGAAAAA